MSQLAFGFDPTLCVGCLACVVACQASRGLPADVRWRSVEKTPPEENKRNVRYLSWSCMHCAEPACLRACPAEAYIKRETDGIVLHLDHQCIGCRYCTWACPYGAPHFDAAAGIVTKCDFCSPRLAEGLAPACVETCFTEALIFGELKDLEREGLVHEWIIGLPESSITAPSVRFRPLNPCGRTDHTSREE